MLNTDKRSTTGWVIRVGRGWVDVVVDRHVRRVSTRPDLLVKAGCTLQIINDQGFALLPTAEPQNTKMQ
jgi:hypothetical protein